MKPWEDAKYLDNTAKNLIKNTVAKGEFEPTEGMIKTIGSALLQARKCGQMFLRASERLLEKNPVKKLNALPASPIVACQGVKGAYSHIACEKTFKSPQISFFSQFEDVFEAVTNSQAEFGILPVENSSAGQVTQVLELVSAYNLYINTTVQIKVRHCLCVHKNTDIADVKKVISHPQALKQCEGYLKNNGYEPIAFSNTAAAALKISKSAENVACICSLKSAQLYNLKVVEESIQDYDDNYTRFICVSKDNILLPNADTVSITLSFPNEAGYLNKLLTCFAVCDLDLCKIQSMPIAGKDFNVRFHLDFKGNIENKEIVYLLSSLCEDSQDFKFLGNHIMVKD